MNKCVKIRVPASTANLGSGFDVFGLALGLYNELEMEMVSGDSGVCIEIDGEGENSLSRDKKNLVWQAALKTFKAVNFPHERYGFCLKAINRIPLARGLGSSAAAALSGILAANAVSGNKLSREDILGLAVEFEGHPDNVAPQLFGGLCVSVMSGGIQVVRLDPPKNLKAVVCVPEFELSTKKARAALPAKISHKDAVFNVSRSALLVAAFGTGNSDLLKIAMSDRLHQPYRKKLVPGFDAVLEEAYKAGACGAALSGAGPAMFAFVPSSKVSQVGRAMERGFASAKVRSKSLVLQFNLKGAEVLSK